MDYINIKTRRVILDINTTIIKMILSSYMTFFLKNFKVEKILPVILRNVKFEHSVVRKYSSIE